MPVKILAAALLSLVMMAAPAAAATLSAEIMGRDVHSQFLADGFIPLPEVQDQNANPNPFTPLADTQPNNGTSTLPGTSNLSFSNPGSEAEVQPERQSESSGSGTFDPMIGGGSNPGSGVGTVPLPGALPMFGLALLVLCGLGARVKRRAAPANS